MNELPLELEHVLRAVPPWRTGPLLTECGQLADGVPVLTRDALIAKVNRQGKARSSLTTCMTCWQTADRHHGTWETMPVRVMARELNRADRGIRESDPAAVRVRDELLAIEELVSRHRDEFDAILGGLGETVRLSDLPRRRRSRRVSQ
jgi:hypothetical protein